MAAVEILITAAAGAALFLVLPKNGAAYQPEYETPAKAGGYEIRRYASFRFVESPQAESPSHGAEQWRRTFALLKQSCAAAGATHGVPLLCEEGGSVRLPALPSTKETASPLGETGPFVVAVARVGGPPSASEDADETVLRTLARAAGYEPDPGRPNVTARYDLSPFTPERWRRTERWTVLRPLHAHEEATDTENVATA